jgi:hypothetical protein
MEAGVAHALTRARGLDSLIAVGGRGLDVQRDSYVAVIGGPMVCAGAARTVETRVPAPVLW